MNQTPSHTLPRVLLVEDDPVSAAFLQEAAAGYPAHVDVAGSLAAASRMAGDADYDLLLIDGHLPDGAGADLLQRLRAHGIDTPAIAHTAGLDAAMREALQARGFAEVLAKPLGIDAVRAALARHLPPPQAGDWNDAVALAALGGDPAHVRALRGLFLAELPAQRTRIAAAQAEGNHAALRDELHRLTASCGFVGASRLAAAVRKLHAAPADTAAMAEVAQAVDALLAAPRD
ncbi:response regulator [Thermomonas brevis]